MGKAVSMVLHDLRDTMVCVHVLEPATKDIANIIDFDGNIKRVTTEQFVLSFRQVGFLYYGTSRQYALETTVGFYGFNLLDVVYVKGSDIYVSSFARIER